MIDVIEFYFRRISYEEEIQVRKSIFSSVKETKFEVRYRDETSSELMDRINEFLQGRKLINIESIWKCSITTGLCGHRMDQQISNANVIGYRVFYEMSKD